MAEPFIAEIRIFAGNFAPRGWAYCNGQLLPISQNTALFSLIGITYGGDGVSTTALPNLQGKAPMHPGRGPGLTNRYLGEGLGVTTVTLTSNQIPNHNHAAVVSTQASLARDPSNNILGNSQGRTPTIYSTTRNIPGNILPTGLKGEGKEHNNMQPYLALNFIIALVGLYPSRS
ncbi:MAG TPA: tail fiber protein [Saprospiraceae bacterium]|nr:phage tail protein [Saprospiraceae bacterium]MCB9269354.1 phage tail protein [Lewinellaceae bacterium]HPG08903.1 tail fiber protein [Saprospiraceae bacterium]HPR00875.1 tail fiber protein [Saprospiraceae bacterium]HQU53778.1 tail fiber protein [Saprospiraceae bacterium]